MRNDKREFWKEVKKFDRKDSGEVAVKIEDLRTHLMKSFNKEKSKNKEHEKIETEVKEFENSLNQSTMKKQCVNSKEIKSAINKLKAKKSVGNDGISAFQLKKCTSKVCVDTFVWLFNLIFNTGYIPEKMNISIIKPILKDKDGDREDFSNIRPIAISNTIAQVFERVILDKISDKLKTNKNQFGFKSKSSCTLALFAIKETILNYVEGGSPCHLVALDAEKAYDHLWREGLFYKLIGKIDNHMWLILKKYYDSSLVAVTLKGITSEVFKVTTGVKQGGILSPFLFNFYINDLFDICLNYKIGARIGDTNMNIVGYCDDLNLLSSSMSHMQTLLNVCMSYGELWRIKFNAKKTKAITFGNCIFKNVKFKLNEMEIEMVKELEILGYTFKNDKLDDNTLIENASKKVWRSFYSLVSFGMKPNGFLPILQAFLYKSYCLSRMTYCLEIMSVSNKTITKINVKQNNIFRFLLNLDNRSVMKHVLPALKVLTLKQLILKRKIGFISQIKDHPLTSGILSHLIQTNPNEKRKSNSFKADMYEIENILGSEVYNMKKREILSKYENTIRREDGIIDSLETCLLNFRNPVNKKMIKLLTQPKYKRLSHDH